MKVCVYGLWHLGSVTAASLASMGHDVVGLDRDPATVANLSLGKPPVAEPGLAELVSAGLNQSTLRFTTDPAAALVDAELVWITFDTPVDDDDNADVSAVLDAAEEVFSFLGNDAFVLASSQLPVGSVAALEQRFRRARPRARVTFGCSPENLRLGSALDAFLKPDRIVVGLRDATDRERVAALFCDLSTRIEWMSIESAEMVKHAVNAFLATSIAFTNEVASICERVGADARDVERGLRSEPRIGRRAYVGAGAAYSGGTLARDVAFLTELGRIHDVPTELLRGARVSNDEHEHWAERRLVLELGEVRGRAICILGLTYKPGTDTLRRSGAVRLCESLIGQGATVCAYDPAISALPDFLAQRMTYASDPLCALTGCDAAVVATPWPQFKSLSPDAVAEVMATPVVLDPSAFLKDSLGASSAIRYRSVGMPA
ncbi:MAG: UDP-glucose dehydrogenase family protein [Acidimicrobiia bacterium]